jgi:transcriptional regulator with XRE-family HTH domain
MEKNLEKRNRKVELSNEAIALKKMREYRSMSVRDVGDLLKISFTTVSHMENGRATIHEEYLKKFFKALKFSNTDFKNFTEESNNFDSVRTNCFKLIENMEPSKMEKTYAMLSLI